MKTAASPLSPKTRSAFKRYFMDAPLRRLKPNVPITTTANTTLSDIAALMRDHSIGSVLIVDGANEPKGIVSERALFVQAATNPQGWKRAPASSIMISPPISVRALGSVGRAIFEMTTANVRHLVIEPSDTSGLGIISMRDVLQYVYRVLTKDIPLEPAMTVAIQNDLQQLLHGPVQALAPHPPITVRATITVQETIQQMMKHSIGSVLITSAAGRLEGIFTERDFVTKVAAHANEPEAIVLRQVMTAQPTSVLSGGSVALALNLMFEGGFRHIPVCEEQEMLVGMLSLRNFLHFLSDAVMADLKAT